jgi:hypothetical protein
MYVQQIAVTLQERVKSGEVIVYTGTIEQHEAGTIHSSCKVTAICCTIPWSNLIVRFFTTIVSMASRNCSGLLV